MQQIRITKNLIQVVKILYAHNKVIVKIENKFRDTLKTTKYLHQQKGIPTDSIGNDDVRETKGKDKFKCLGIYYINKGTSEEKI